MGPRSSHKTPHETDVGCQPLLAGRPRAKPPHVAYSLTWSRGKEHSGGEDLVPHGDAHPGPQGRARERGRGPHPQLQRLHKAWERNCVCGQPREQVTDGELLGLAKHQFEVSAGEKVGTGPQRAHTLCHLGGYVRVPTNSTDLGMSVLVLPPRPHRAPQTLGGGQ